MRSSQAKLFLATLAVLQFVLVAGYLLWTTSHGAFNDTPEGNRLLYSTWNSQILTVSSGLVMGVFAFYFGSSQGSAAKDQTVAALATQTSTTTSTAATATEPAKTVVTIAPLAAAPAPTQAAPMPVEIVPAASPLPAKVVLPPGSPVTPGLQPPIEPKP